jgi:hypothetical protein
MNSPVTNLVSIDVTPAVVETESFARVRPAVTCTRAGAAGATHSSRPALFFSAMSDEGLTRMLLDRTVVAWMGAAVHDRCCLLSVLGFI